MWNYGQLIVTATQQVSSQWVQNQTFVARKSMQEISLMVILKAVFGMYEGERFEQIKTLLTSLLSVADSPLSSSLLFFPVLQ
jgi:cytochrome P450